MDIMDSTDPSERQESVQYELNIIGRPNLKENSQTKLKGMEFKRDGRGSKQMT